MHQSSWVWSIQFLPEEDLDASPLTTWFGGPFGVTGRQWLTMMTSRPSYYKFTWPHCPPGTELPRLSRRLVTPCVQLTISLVNCHSEDTTRNRTPRSVCYIRMRSGQKIDTNKNKNISIEQCDHVSIGEVGDLITVGELRFLVFKVHPIAYTLTTPYTGVIGVFSFKCSMKECYKKSSAHKTLSSR